MRGTRQRRTGWWALVVGLLLALAVVVVVLVGGAGDEADEPSASSGPSGPTPSVTAPTDVIPAPTPGSLDPVPVEEVSTAPPVALTETGDFGTGVTLRIIDVSAVEGVARGPGQVSGPALLLTLEAHNDSARAVSLEGMVVALDYGEAHTPAMPLSEPKGDPFGGELAPGATAEAAYVFAVPEESRDRIRVTTSYTGSAPTVVFRGSAA